MTAEETIALSKRALMLRTNTVSYVIAGGSLLPRFIGSAADSSGSHPPSQMWIASTVTSALGEGGDGLSRVPLAGGDAYLKDLLEADPEAFMGRAHVDCWGTNPGYLIKLLNSKDRLLVQVHPDKARAKRYFRSDFGKTEAWYVVDAEDGAMVHAGFVPGVTKEILRRAIEEQDSDRILGLLHAFPVAAGDVLFIPAGLPHALGSGSLVVEIQEPTDITLRAERRRPSGEMLPEEMLHAGLGMDVLLECFDYDCADRGTVERRLFLRPLPVRREEGCVEEALVSYRTTPYFAMHSISMGVGSVYAKRNAAFSAGLVIAGKGRLEGDGFAADLERGSEFFIPHGVERYRYSASGDLKIIECYPPSSGGEDLRT